VMKLGLSFWLALPLSAIVTGIIGYALGFLLVRNVGFSFLILTSVLSMLIVLIYGNIDWLGGYQGIEAIPPPDSIPIPYLTQVDFVSKASFYYLMLLLLGIVMLAFSAFYKSWAGRAWSAIDLSPSLAESIGVNLRRYRLLAFVVSSSAAGLVGSFYAHYIGAVTPSSFGIFKTIHVHICAILGGLGYAMLGPIIGALIMTFIPEMLRITGEIEPIFTGFLLIFLIKFLPGGLLSLLGAKKAKARDARAVLRTLGRHSSPRGRA
jgi:branched-chain amino acid transport system permease protein